MTLIHGKMQDAVMRMMTLYRKGEEDVTMMKMTLYIKDQPTSLVGRRTINENYFQSSYTEETEEGYENKSSFHDTHIPYSIS